MHSSTRKPWLRLTISVVAVSAIVSASCVGIGGGERQSVISVTGLDPAAVQQLTYVVDNARVLETGGINTFTIRLDKADFFDGLRGTFKVFAESDDRIQLIYGDEVYTVSEYDSNTSAYALYGEYVLIRDGDESLSHFPFPTDKIIGYDPLYPTEYATGSMFRINCDLSYLQRFYAIYGASVKVGGSTMQYRNLAIVVKDGGRVEIVVLPSNSPGGEHQP